MCEIFSCVRTISIESLLVMAWRVDLHLRLFAFVFAFFFLVRSVFALLELLTVLADTIYSNTSFKQDRIVFSTLKYLCTQL